MLTYLIYILLALAALQIILLLTKKSSLPTEFQSKELEQNLFQLRLSLESLEKNVKDEFQRSRMESQTISQSNRSELALRLDSFSIQFDKNVK